MNKAEFDSFVNWAYQYKAANGEYSLQKLRKLLKSNGLSVDGGFLECAARYYTEVLKLTSIPM